MRLINVLAFCLVLFFVTTFLYAQEQLVCPDRSQIHRDFVQSAFRDLQLGRSVRGTAGGLVFYDRGFYPEKASSLDDCWRFLEAAPRDLEGSTQWTGLPNMGRAVGYGRANTKAIAEQSSHKNCAARRCLEYFPAGHKETQGQWFLPSKNELYHMNYNLRIVQNHDGFAIDLDWVIDHTVVPFAIDHWSSSEYSTGHPWSRETLGLTHDEIAKKYNIRLRCVRAF